MNKVANTTLLLKVSARPWVDLIILRDTDSWRFVSLMPIRETCPLCFILGNQAMINVLFFTC